MFVQVVKDWVKLLTRQRGYTDQMVEDANALIFTFGSYRLGVSVIYSFCERYLFHCVILPLVLYPGFRSGIANCVGSMLECLWFQQIVSGLKPEWNAVCLWSRGSYSDTCNVKNKELWFILKARWGTIACILFPQQCCWYKVLEIAGCSSMIGP